MYRWLFAAVASCAFLAAQTTKPTEVFEKAPPELDQALRDRVSKFFQAHVEGKFRLAEEVVADDSKDFFYLMQKTKYLSFDIVRVNYSDNFTKAAVVTGVEVEWRSPRIGVMIVKPPLTSLWKLENDKWVWYVVPQKDWETPWGKMNPGPDDPNKVKKLFTGVNVTDVTSQITIDKTEMRLSGYEPSMASAVITNSLPGDIHLRMIASPRTGMQVRLDKESLKAGEKATVSVQYQPPNPDPKPHGELVVEVQPTGQVFRIALVFDIQPELKKLIPKELQK